MAPPVVTLESREARKDIEAAPKAPKPTESTPQPLSDEAIAQGRAAIAAAASDYPARLEARRSLIFPLCEAGQAETALAEIEALLDDVDKSEGGQMAERVAMSTAAMLQHRKAWRPAILTYGMLMARWPDTRFAADVLNETGGCHLELREYAEAEKQFQRLVEEHNESSFAAWGWRRLALAQLLRGEFDLSLASLEMMSTKFTSTEHGHYARMRRGYVQMVAGRFEEARKTYETFLLECRGSKYCDLSREQLRQLDKLQLSMATHPQPAADAP